MDTRRIGDIEVSARGFGGWAIGGPFAAPDGKAAGWGEVDDGESIAAIRAAFDAGITLFDTANVYGTGHSEKVLAGALGNRRSEIVLATKWGNTMREEDRVLTGGDGSVEGMRRSLEDSLRRLNTDYVDLFQFHLNDYDGPEIGELCDALEELVAAGKIRAYGWSTDFPDRATKWLNGPNYQAVQTEINVLNDNPGIIEVAEANGLACLNRGPLAMGLLSGKYGATSQITGADVRHASPDWLRYFDNGVPTAGFLDMLSSVRDILTTGGRSLVQGALAWLWGRSEANIPIPGVRTVAQATENAAAMSYGPLTKAQMSEIAALLGRNGSSA